MTVSQFGTRTEPDVFADGTAVSMEQASHFIRHLGRIDRFRKKFNLKSAKSA